MWYMRIIWITMCLMRWFMCMQQVEERILRGIEDDLIKDVDYVYVHEVDTCGAKGFEAAHAS